MLTGERIVFLLDVDNTLLDNDRFAADLSAWLDQAFGVAERERYWSLYAGLRTQLGYADYLGALQLLRNGSQAQQPLQRAGDFLLEYPFAERLYPAALEAISHLSAFGPVVIVSDGDMVLQPRKIRQAGLAAAVNDRVLLYVHKQDSLDDLQRRYPASHYVMVDDKPLLLAAMKQLLGPRLSTVFVRQGHYAVEAAGTAIDPPPDLSIGRIGELLNLVLADFLPAAPAATLFHAPELS